jgi:succinate dehydrogenase / fumarate reductase cytochrome b subunit
MMHGWTRATARGTPDEWSGVARMAATVALYRTSIGKKAVMAVTGFILYLFMILHIYGNLKVFEGREKFNAYSDYLRTAGNPIFFRTELLWIIRIVLLSSVILHIVAAAQLTQRSYASRPVRYVNKKDTDATLASRTMRWGGLVILFFIIYHILDLTLGTAHSGAYQQGDVYGNVVSGFSHWYVTLFYLLAMLALGFHLYHGVWSMFQTLGVNRRKYNRFFRGLALVSAVLIAVGGCVVPISVLTGIIS